MINELFPSYNKKPLKNNYFSHHKKKTEPKVSIVTPVYNSTSIMQETIDSILSQSLYDFEWIIVNDGSDSKATLKMLDKLEKQDSRVKIIHQENKRLAGARNTGLKHSKADFIFLIDSDDLIEPTALEKFYNFLRINEGCYFVNSFLVNFDFTEFFWNANFNSREKFLDQNFGSSMFMARRSLFDHVTYDESDKNINGAEDWDFWLNCSNKNLWGHTIQENLIWYRTTDPKKRNWSNLTDEEKFNQLSDHLRKKYPKLEKITPSLPVLTSNNLLAKKYNPLQKNTLLEKKKKHVLCIFPYLNVGGVDKVNIEIFKGLSKKGFSFTVATTLESDHLWEPLYAEVTPDIFHLANYCKTDFYFEYISYLIESRKPDLIFISNSLYGYLSIPNLKKEFPQIPILDYLHSSVPYWLNGGYPNISSFFSKFINKTLTTYERMRQDLISAGGIASNVETCYINVDEKKFSLNKENRSKIRSSWEIYNEYPIIVFSGRISPEKQPDVLVESIKRLHEHTQDFLCLVIGDGPAMPELKSLIEKNNLQGKIWCLGNQTNEEVAKYLDASDIFFLPSEYEGISLAIFEAMSKGLAIISADVGGQKELVTSDCGRLIERSSKKQEIEHYSNSLIDLVSNYDLRNKMGQNSRKRILDNFRSDQMIDQVHKAFEQVIKKGSSVKADIESHQYQLLLDMYFDTQSISNEIWGQLSNLKSSLENNENQSKEVEVIKQWYFKEYEVLPLWYKRIGHLIKMVNGQKSIKETLKKKREPEKK